MWHLSNDWWIDNYLLCFFLSVPKTTLKWVPESHLESPRCCLLSQNPSVGFFQSDHFPLKPIFLPALVAPYLRVCGEFHVCMKICIFAVIANNNYHLISLLLMKESNVASVKQIAKIVLQVSIYLKYMIIYRQNIHTFCSNIDIPVSLQKKILSLDWKKSSLFYLLGQEL